MKTRSDYLKSFVYVFALVAAVAVVPGLGQETLSGGYQFGPGSLNTVSDDVKLNVPARTNLTLVVLLQRDLTAPRSIIPVATDVRVAVDVIRPDGTTAVSVPASATVVSAGIPIPVVPLVGTFTSQRGCPSPWTVRIRSANNLAPPVRVFGSVSFGFVKPGTLNLDMESDLNIDKGTTATRTLAGHDLLGATDRSLIAGTGPMRIRAKWHTDPLDVFNIGRFFPLTVALLRPNGTVAATETGVSAHATSGTKVDFSYTVTDTDARMTGTWKLRITSPATNGRIVGFDIERGLDPLVPSFNSTFIPQCSSAIAVS